MVATLALLCTATTCGGLSANVDPLASMAQAVREDKRSPPPLSESWRRAPPAPLTLQPAVGINHVYLAIGNQLVAWRVSNGETSWGPVELESDVSAAPAAIGRQVVIATGGNDATGPRIWWYSTDGSLDSQAPVAAPISEISAVPGTLIYLDNLGVGRLDDSNEWHVALDDATAVDLAAEHGLALVATVSGRLLALDVRDGETRWRHDAESKISRAHVSNKRVYIGTADGDIIALNIADGRVAWRRTLGTSVARPTRFSGSPASTPASTPSTPATEHSCIPSSCRRAITSTSPPSVNGLSSGPATAPGSRFVGRLVPSRRETTRGGRRPRYGWWYRRRRRPTVRT